MKQTFLFSKSYRVRYESIRSTSKAFYQVGEQTCRMVGESLIAVQMQILEKNSCETVACSYLVNVTSVSQCNQKSCKWYSRMLLYSSPNLTKGVVRLLKEVQEHVSTG